MRYPIRLSCFPALADRQFIVTQKFVHHVIVHVIQFKLCFSHPTTLCIVMNMYDMMRFSIIVPSSRIQAHCWCSNGAGIPYDILVIPKSIACSMYILIDSGVEWLNVFWKLNYRDSLPRTLIKLLEDVPVQTIVHVVLAQWFLTSL